VAALALSRDGKWLASGGVDERVKLWEPESGRLVRTLDLRFGPNSYLAFLDDNVTLLVHRERTVHQVNVATGETRGTFRLDDGEEDRWRRVKDEPSAFALSPDGSLLVNGQVSGSVRLWDVTLGKAVQRPGSESDAISAAAFSADNQVYAWATSRGKLTIAKVSDDQLRQLTPDGSRWIDALAFSPDGKRLACGGGGGVITIFAADSGKELARIDAHANEVTCLAYTPDGAALVSGGYDGCVRVWDARTGREATRWSSGFSRLKPELQHGRISVALSPDGARLTTAGTHQPVYCRDAETGKELRPFVLPPEYASAGVVFSGEGDRLSVVAAGVLHTWDLATGRELRHVALGRDFEQAALSPDGRVVMGRTGTQYLTLYHVPTRRHLQVRVTPARTSDSIYRIAASPDGKWVGTLRSSGLLQLWDAATAREVSHFQVPSRVFHFAFTPDRNLLVTLSVNPPGERRGVSQPVEQRITRWVADAGAPLPAFVGEQGDPVSLAVSPDGKTLVTADESGPLRLWEIATGKPRGVLKGHQGAVVSLAFSADGKRLLSGSRDTTALLWDLPSAASGDRPAPRDLTAHDLDALWADLLSDDAALAYRGVATLAASPRRSVPYLRSHLQPARADADRFARLVDDLDSTHFETRQQAHAELAELSDLAEPVLRAALKDPPSAEVRRLAEDLLEKAKSSKYLLTGERLRTWRALEALEACGTSEACDVLATLAQGDEAARLTGEAKMALERIHKRGVASR
jgi:WD40 repeat protein